MGDGKEQQNKSNSKTVIGDVLYGIGSLYVRKRGKKNPEFCNPAWKKDGKEVSEALLDDVVIISSEVKNIPDGSTITFKIFEEGESGPISKINVSVSNGKTEMSWKVIEKEDEVINKATHLKKEEYPKPKYYFTAEYNGAESEQSGLLSVSPSSFKLPNAFYNRYNKDTMKKYWAEGEPGGKVGKTKCSDFLPDLLKELGIDVWENITGGKKLGAAALTISFVTNPKLRKIAFGKTAEVKANNAQALANAGYLVLAAITDGNHVAVVGSQWLSYGSYPDEKAWEGNAMAFQEGNGYDGDGVLWQYPVFVQAGSYTGVVNPGNAMGREDLRILNKVNYFLYKPR